MTTRWAGGMGLAAVSLGITLAAANAAASLWVARRVASLPGAASMDTLERYRHELHHVRDPADVLVEAGAPATLLLYTVLRPFRPEASRNVLIQGDSWAQRAGFGEPAQALASVADARGLGMVAAGIVSYAPSPMTVQLRLLRRDFGLAPDVVVALLDQTDLGDELCRYRNQRVLDERGRLERVAPPATAGGLFDTRDFMDGVRNLRSGAPALAKVVRQARLVHGLRKRRGAEPCGWDRIARPLETGVTDAERKFFAIALDAYLDEVFADSVTSRLILVTHPHRRHVAAAADGGRYTLDVALLVAERIRASPYRNRITHLDFGPVFHDVYEGLPIEEVFEPGDPASHITQDAMAARFVPRLMQAVLQGG